MRPRIGGIQHFLSNMLSCRSLPVAVTQCREQVQLHSAEHSLACCRDTVEIGWRSKTFSRNYHNTVIDILPPFARVWDEGGFVC